MIEFFRPREPAVRERLEKLGFETVGNTPAEFAAQIRTEAVRWTKVIRESEARAH